MKRSTLFLFAVFTFALSTANWAQTSGSQGEGQPSGSSAQNSTSSDAELRSQVEQLIQLVHEQQKHIEALENANLARPTAAGVPTASSELSVDSQNTSTAPTSTLVAQDSSKGQRIPTGSSDERIRNLERQIQGLGPISFSGDVRLRAEPFFGGPADESLDRIRGRFRARFNANARFGDQFRTGITLASGDINDPTSTNQTLTGFYARKAVALDQAFVEFTPHAFKPLTLTAGKFRYPWFNTELTWDKDLNPEGAAQTLAFDVHTPILKKIAFVGFELPFAEIAGTSTADKRVTQAITYGGQLQTAWALGSHVNLSAYTGFYDFRNSDLVALALARASAKNPQTPFSGVLALTSGNPVQNSTYTTTATSVVTVGGTTYPTGVTAISNAQFASRFGLFDSLARLEINTGHPRVPVTFIGDYVQNTEACANLAKIVAVPANTSTQTFKQTVNATCNPHQRRGYWAEGTVGRLEKKGDLQFGYAHMYIEREAVLGNFNYSDIRQGSNVTQHRFISFYQVDKNVQLGFTALVGRPLASTEPWLTRLQFDTVYIF